MTRVLGWLTPVVSIRLRRQGTNYDTNLRGTHRVFDHLGQTFNVVPPRRSLSEA